VNIQENISLKPFNTFGIDVRAKYFISVTNINELKCILYLDEYKHKFILGGGSNILLTKNIDALVIHINLKGICIVSQVENEVLVKVSAGENWHDFVLWCINHDLGGIENLSLIPGNVGAAPIQNIGAYGVELKDVFESCEALSLTSKTIKKFTKSGCKFGYRNSIFKNELKNKYVIFSITLRLSKNKHYVKTEYGAIRAQLKKNKVETPTIKDISDAIITIRSSKLPDPKTIGNSGSFFKNPVIDKTHYVTLKQNFPNIPSYKVDDKLVKIPAGWLIEQAGFKGKVFKNYGVHKNQALVLVNYGEAKGQDIEALALLIQKTISHLFNINLELEVNIV